MISMGNVWDRTAEFLSDNLGAIMPVALLAIFVPATLAANLSALQPGASPAVGAWLGIGVLLLSLAGFWGQLAITALAIDPDLGRGAATVATRRFPAALLVMIVILVAGVVAVAPVGAILAAAGVDLAAMAGDTMPKIPPSAAIGVFFYGLVLVALLLWIGARLAVVLPAIVGDRLALRAIPRAWQLTRGVALKIIGVLILYGVVSVIANLAATSAFGAVMFVVAGRGEDGLSLASVLTTIVGGTVSTAFTVLGTAFLAKLYVALLARREAAAAA